jgi:hypothetical protein
MTAHGAADTNLAPPVTGAAAAVTSVAVDEKAASSMPPAEATAAAASAAPRPAAAGDGPVSTSSFALLLFLVGGAHVGLAHLVGLKVPDPYPNVVAFGAFTFGLVVVKRFLIERAGRSDLLGWTAGQTLSLRQLADNIHVFWSLVGLFVVMACTGKRTLSDPEIGIGIVMYFLLWPFSFGVCTSSESRPFVAGQNGTHMPDLRVPSVQVYSDAWAVLEHRETGRTAAPVAPPTVIVAPTPTAETAEPAELFEKA